MAHDGGKNASATRGPTPTPAGCPRPLSAEFVLFEPDDDTRARTSTEKGAPWGDAQNIAPRLRTPNPTLKRSTPRNSMGTTSVFLLLPCCMQEEKGREA